MGLVKISCTILEAIREGKTRSEINTDFGGDVQLVDMLFLFLIHNLYITKTSTTTENKSGWEMTAKGRWLLSDFCKTVIGENQAMKVKHPLKR